MRGTVLLVDEHGSIDTGHLREAGLKVYEVREPNSAPDCVWDVDPDVIVVVASSTEAAGASELRPRADYATSIIVVGTEPRSKPGADSGVDCVVSPTADLLYEIHRALILRRSGRRLPWNS